MYAAEWPCCHDPLRFSLGSDDLSPSARQPPSDPQELPEPPARDPFHPFVEPRARPRASTPCPASTPSQGCGGGRGTGCPRPCARLDAFFCATREMCHPFCTKTDGASSSEWQGRWRPRARVRRFHLTLSSVQPEKCVTHSAQKTAASIAQGIIIF